MTTKKKGEYAVGNGKPPKHSQFKPGQSGNPSGRPRGSKNFQSIFCEALEEEVTLKSGDKLIKEGAFAAMTKVQRQKALRGDTRAYECLMSRFERIGAFHQVADAPEAQPLTEEENALLDFFFEQAKGVEA